MKFSESGISNIAAALCQFQSIVTNPKKESENPHYKSKYADLDSIITTIRPALKETGLAFIQEAVTDEKGNIGVCTTLLHISGEYITFNPVYIPVSKSAAHQVGSALTYARRYSLGTALGIATDKDDDANAIQPPPRKVTQSQLNKITIEAKKKHLQDNAQKALVYKYFEKTSLDDLTVAEANQFIQMLAQQSEEALWKEIRSVIHSSNIVDLHPKKHHMDNEDAMLEGVQ